MIQEYPEVEIPIDPDLIINGIKNPTYLVVVGLSGLQVIEEVKKTKKMISHILVIEPNLGHFHQTIKRQWIGSLVDSQTVDFLIGIKPEEMGPHLYKIFNQGDSKVPSRATRCMQPEIIIDPFAYPTQPDGKPHPVAKQIIDCVMDSVRQIFLAMGCASDSFNRWEQLIKNEPNLERSYNIKGLYDRFKDTPAFVLGAGPSLEGFILACKEHDLHKKSLVIACDAALKRLLAEGIRPHIVTRCERKLTTIFDGIKKEDTDGIWYAAYPWTPPEYFELFENNFMMFRDNGICKWTGYDPGAVNGGVSSANAALELAFIFGCPEIYMTGVDLCFIGGRSHMSGTEVEFDLEKSKAKWTKITTNGGEETTTIPVWKRCLGEYEGALFKHKGKAQVYNLSKDGAKIGGAQFIEWSQAVSQLEKSGVSVHPSKFKKHADKPSRNEITAYHERKKKTLEMLHELRKDLFKTLGNVTDIMVIAQREQDKILNNIKNEIEFDAFVKATESLKKQFLAVYKNPCGQIDRFKKNWFSRAEFCMTILDTIQLDYFQTENRCSFLPNTVELEFERLKMYVFINLNFLRTAQYYCNEMIKLFENGPDFTLKEPTIKEIDWEKSCQTS